LPSAVWRMARIESSATTGTGVSSSFGVREVERVRVVHPLRPPREEGSEVLPPDPHCVGLDPLRSLLPGVARPVLHAATAGGGLIQ
jgi:hypothetical protein